MKLSFKQPLTRFSVVALLLYIFWYLLYELWLHPQGWLDRAIIDNLILISGGALRFIGFNLIPDSFDESIRTIGIDGTHGLWVGDPCNGITLFSLFTGFVIAYPGPIKKKLWFIPLGLVTIHLLNVIRIMALTMIVYYFPDPAILDFNHTYTFTILVYSYVFLLWYIWANKLSEVSSS